MLCADAATVAAVDISDTVREQAYRESAQQLGQFQPGKSCCQKLVQCLIPKCNRLDPQVLPSFHMLYCLLCVTYVRLDRLLPMQMSILELSRNRLVGTLPEEWGNLHSVSSLPLTIYMADWFCPCSPVNLKIIIDRCSSRC